MRFATAQCLPLPQLADARAYVNCNNNAIYDIFIMANLIWRVFYDDYRTTYAHWTLNIEHYNNIIIIEYSIYEFRFNFPFYMIQITLISLITHKI